MKVNDALIGMVMLLLSLAVLWHVSDFPPVPGQPYGSALFPALAAGGLAVGSLLLSIQGFGRGGAAPDSAAADSNTPPRLLPVVLVAATILFYILLSDLLGFVICGVIVVSVLMAAFRVRPVWILPVAIIATLIIHTGFYKFLRVPLPWGLLQPIAW